uniref:ADP ribosylation factor like GTPase 14 n=1 Tax=Junco hyemalis TaxID=40217 RepID=A0A8C5IM33_JUNHY
MGLQNGKPSRKGANIPMLGLDSAGKSTLLYKLRYKDAFITLPTIGFNVDMIEAGKDFTLTFWDVGGQKKMRELWEMFYIMLQREGINSIPFPSQNIKYLKIAFLKSLVSQRSEGRPVPHTQGDSNLWESL